MSTSNTKSRRRLGDKSQPRRSNTTEASDLDSSFADPDSSFASSSATPDEVISNDKGSRAKVGGLGALGARVRSLSTGQRKSQSGEERATSLASMPKVNRSKSSLFDEGKRSRRSSRLFDALGLKSRSDLAETAVSPSQQPQDRFSPVEVVPIPTPPAPRPRLSVSGLSSHIARASSYFSLEPASPNSEAIEGAPSPGDFNLRSFRNVRRQDTSSSYAVANAFRPSATPPLPTSSASQYTNITASDSRPDSFLSADDSQQTSSATSPWLLTPSSNQSEIDLALSESKQSSPRMEAVRFQANSMSAGRFRQATANSFKNADDTSGGPTTPTEGFQRSIRPNSPFRNLTASPSQTLAALEAEMMKGRTTPLMFLHQGEESRATLVNPGPKASSKTDRDSPVPSKASGEGNRSYQRALSHQDAHEQEQQQDIAPPKLPWLRDEAELARRRRQSSTSFSQGKETRGELMSPLANVNMIGDMRDVLPRPSESPTTSPVDRYGAAFLPARALSRSPTQADNLHEHLSPQDTDGFGIGRRLQRWSMFNGATLMNGHGSNHRRGESIPADNDESRLSQPSSGHRRTSSTVDNAPTIGQAKAEEMVSFHEQQAPLLSAAQSRTEIPLSQNARIAWPSPPCIKPEYFSHLSALHQHSLYEQHCKAADHALAEYLRLMSGIVPVDAMKQPGPLFSTASMSLQVEKRRRSSEPLAFNHIRSRSISSPGLQGSGNSSQTRRRSLTPAARVSPAVPVPPLPSESMLEKMEERMINRRSSIQLERLETNTSDDTTSGSLQSLARRPSAKFMMPRHAS